MVISDDSLKCAPLGWMTGHWEIGGRDLEKLCLGRERRNEDEIEGQADHEGKNGETKIEQQAVSMPLKPRYMLRRLHRRKW